MEDIGRFFTAVMSVFRYEFTLYDFTFSFWEVFVFTIVVSIVAWILRVLFLGD